MRILIFILFINLNIHAQINGQIIDVTGTGTLPGVVVELTGNNFKTESDFDGKFSIEVPENLIKTNILLKYEMITVEIENINLKNKPEIDFGKFFMPYFKEISLEEYDNLNKTEKKNCEPIYNWNHIRNELIGYFYFNKLSKNYLIWYCGKIEKKVFDFKFTKRNKTITVDWEKISECK